MGKFIVNLEIDIYIYKITNKNEQSKILRK